MLAEALLKYETLDAEEIKAIMTGKGCPDKNGTWPVIYQLNSASFLFNIYN